MPLPSWVDFGFAEQSAATMARGLSGATDAWGTLLAHAQAILASRTDTRHSENQASYEFNEWSDLVAAARILDNAASTLGLNDSRDRHSAAILAACAFGMSGTAVSATAAIRGHRLFDYELSDGELTALAVSSPALSRQVYSRLPTESKHRTCLESLTYFLATGDEQQFTAATTALEEAILQETNGWEGYLLRLSRLSLVHAGRLATAKVLARSETHFPRGYLGRLIDESPVLLPSQYEAINKYGVLDSGRNLLIALPTGTGKTLLGELALMAALGRDPGLVCYIAPYVALGRQVAEKIAGHVPIEVRVHQLMGAYQEPEPLNPESNFEVVVATPERFDAMLRLRPDLVPYIRCVVFDEAHMIDNGERGVRLEGIITRLRFDGAAEPASTKVCLAVCSSFERRGSCKLDWHSGRQYYPRNLEAGCKALAELGSRRGASVACRRRSFTDISNRSSWEGSTAVAECQFLSGTPLWFYQAPGTSSTGEYRISREF